MTKSIKTIILTILSISAMQAMAQDSTKTKKIREYHISLSDISPLDISIKYKRQLGNKTFFKIGLINLSLNTVSNKPYQSNNFPISNHSYSAGLELGIEFRKYPAEKFTFFHGPNVSFTYNTNITQQDNPALPQDQRKNTIVGYRGGIPYTMGLLFKLNNHFLVTAEINPGVFVTYRETEGGSSTSANFSFTNNNGILSIAYRL